MRYGIDMYRHGRFSSKEGSPEAGPLVANSRATEDKSSSLRIKRIRDILSSRNLSIYKLSALTRQRFPREPSYHIPRNFYFQLGSAWWSPRLAQIVALSELLNYPLIDLLAV